MTLVLIGLVVPKRESRRRFGHARESHTVEPAEVAAPLARSGGALIEVVALKRHHLGIIKERSD
jgi:hypothetical protein